MALTFNDHDANGNATKTFSFPSYRVEDIKVDVDGVTKTVSTHYNITGYTTTGGGNVVFTSGNIPASPAKIRIRRETDVTAAKATFVAGSSVKAEDLNNNITQVRYATQEQQEQTLVTSDIKDAAITTAKILADNITGALIADDQINSEHYVDGSIDTAHIADGQVTTAKIADFSVTSAKIANLSVETGKLAADAVTNAKIADDSIDSEHYVDGSIDTAHIAGAQVTDAKLASNSVTTSKITDANVTTAKVADANITLAKLASDLKQTAISNSDTQLPTSGAVVDYVAAQIAPIGGLEVIATEVAFPNTQPSAGVVISIADAGGIVVDGSGSSNTGRTVGGSTVTINGINSAFNSTTIAAGVSFMVSSTGSGQIYNFHKATLKEADILNLSNDINDFAARYRVGASNPTSDLDSGDLFFNTGSSKLLVYNGTTSAWEETQSVGNFFINTISAFSGTGGNNATFNGSAYKFNLSNPGTTAEQHLVSINGVVQKPNSGTSQPSEGFAIDGSAIIFSAAPPSGADFFIITVGAAVSIGTPSNNTVSTDVLTSGAVTTVKIADDAVTDAKLANSINSAIAANTAKTTNATHTGDVTGSTSLTLAASGVSAGSYGSATAIPAITVDAKGRITAASTNSINTSTIPVADESSDTTCFPVFVTAASGDLAPKSGSNLTFNSATGALGATSYTGDGSSLTGVASAVADGCIYENSQTISNNYTITTNKNALSAGPITIANGVTLTVPSGSVYTIV